MGKFKISIIVPIYNSENYLERCINSLINQTLKEIEIILINDGSKDNSLKIAREYESIDDRIVVIDKLNGGVSSARNTGILASKGEYISFVDSDDWCEKDMFQSMYNVTTNNNIDFINIGYSIDNSNGKSVKIKKSNNLVVTSKNNEISEVLYNITLGYCIMKLYKREIIIENNILFNTNISLGEDAVFVQDYIRYINSIADINSAGYHYVRCNNESLSTKYDKNIVEFINEFWSKENYVVEKFPKYGELRKIGGFTKNIYGTIFYITNNYKNGCKLNGAERRREIKKYMNDSEINFSINQYRTKKLSHIIFIILYKLKSPYVMDLAYSLRKNMVNLKLKLK